MYKEKEVIFLLIANVLISVNGSADNNQSSSEGVMQCYDRDVAINKSRIVKCRAGSCCFGVVGRSLMENETLATERGGCWHNSRKCDDVCHHKLLERDNNIIASVCHCGTPLCNNYMIYHEREVPVTEKPPPPDIPPPPPSNNQAMIGIVIGCIVLCLILVGVSFLAYRRIVNKKKLTCFWEDAGDGGVPGELETGLIDRYPNGMAIPEQYENEDEIQLLHLIGHGRFGQVLQAKVRDQLIAIKQFHPSDQNSFFNELLIMTIKQAPNLLTLIGHIYSPMDNQLWLISEFMPLGNLCDYLRTFTLTIPQCLHLLSSFIGGLCFLHSDPKPVAHRDIKSRNVLLDNHKNCKIADFGLGLVLDYEPGGALNEKAAPPTQVGTPRYMAPEVLEGSMFYREAEAHMRIDVYAASLVMWEMMSRTQLDQRDQVPPYMLPFERHIPGHPTASEMKVLVAEGKVRPNLRTAWANHPVFSKLEVTLTESWDNDENARLSCKTIQARVLPLLSTTETDSEVSI